MQELAERLTPHFTLAEFIGHERDAFEANTMSAIWWMRLKTVATELEVIRSHLGGHAITITSGWRSHARNKRIGGSATSDHMTAWAVDMKHGLLDARDFYRAIQPLVRQRLVRCDQLIGYTTHVHLGCAPARRWMMWEQ